MNRKKSSQLILLRASDSTIRDRGKALDRLWTQKKQKTKSNSNGSATLITVLKIYKQNSKLSTKLGKSAQARLMYNPQARWYS